MRPSSTARRYAEAAFDVARQSGDVAGWLNDVRSANAALADQRLSRYFRDPNVGHEERLRMVDTAFGALRPQVVNLLRILALKQRIQLLPAILQELETLDREARGIEEAHVVVARPVSEQEKTSIANRLGSATGRTVDVHLEVDPAILGGIVVRLGDRLIDASVAGRLQRLRQELV